MQHDLWNLKVDNHDFAQERTWSIRSCLKEISKLTRLLYVRPDLTLSFVSLADVRLQTFPTLMDRQVALGPNLATRAPNIGAWARQLQAR